MNTLDKRVASIRMFTVPGHHAAFGLVNEYARVAAQWERLRLLEHQESPFADDERFLRLSAILQRLSKDLGLESCTFNMDKKAVNGVVGITDRRGFLPNDVSRFRSGTWHEATAIWCQQ